MPAISSLVTEADLKLLIHSSAVREKYAWLKAVLAQEETYLRLAGFLGGTGGGGKTGIPAALQGHTQTGNPAALTPVQGAERSGEYVLNFDPSGADAEFIRNVPLKYSSSGAEGLVYHAAAVWLGLPENRFADPSYEHGEAAAAST